MVRLLGLVVLLILVGFLVFRLLGGNVDVDADVNAPDVNVDPGELPDVDVSPAEPAEAGSPG
jgi:hypothetical protein